MPAADSMRTAVRRSRLAYRTMEPVYRRRAVARWQRDGRPVPAPAGVKRDILLTTAREHGLRVLVETGTYRGDTVLALARYFDRVVTIELSPALHATAVRLARKIPNATLLLGDSGVLLPQVLATLTVPALFWLDAHCSLTRIDGSTARGEEPSPAGKELAAVLSHPVAGHVVLVDDAREFRDSRSGYPAADTVTGAAARHGYSVAVRDDIFFLTPQLISR